jgi:WD repeat and SOF domain-containing protein 1
MNISQIFNSIFFLQTILTGITHHRSDPFFATCGEVCQLWEESRNEPIRTFKWGVDSLHDVKYNYVQTNLLGKF